MLACHSPPKFTRALAIKLLPLLSRHKNRIFGGRRDGSPLPEVNSTYQALANPLLR
jgi:hypothetical protein